MKKPAEAKAAPMGVSVTLDAAILFGASTPFAKLLLGDVPPVLLAGLLYLGSGFGLTLWGLGNWLRSRRQGRPAREAGLNLVQQLRL